jgi:hypothetical protein
MKTYRISYTNPIINPIIVQATSLRTAINKATRQLEKVRADLYALGLCADHLAHPEIQDATLESEGAGKPTPSIDFAGFDTLKSLAAL